MAVFLSTHQLAFIFGLLGNILSFLVILAPLPTFYTIYRKKSSEGYQSIPYVVAISSATLYLYYGLLKSAFFIISINSIGCAIEIAYLIFYLIYAPPKEKKFTVKLILLLNVGAIGLVLFITKYVIKGPKKLTAVGWTCLAYNVARFAAPLSIVRRVIKTKSVEFMPFSLSFFLTLSAITWFLYGLFIKDLFIATPNVLGFAFGIAQMILYFIFKGKKGNETNTKQQGQQCKEDQLSRIK
uniref:Bidirectional sugar transporter SWEET n=1 Tax=Litchi chinensis TaxID=151069 RepID=A0A6C0G923_LITCN|nr:sugar efflux transporter 9b [Litchi chinensis]